LSTTRRSLARHRTRPECECCTKRLRAAFPDFRPEIHWQVAAGDLVTTYKTYDGTHQGDFLGVPATGRKVTFHTVDAMRVVDGKITEHWGVATLLDLMQQLGVVPSLAGPR
jgi:predicted ester cyclase